MIIIHKNNDSHAIRKLPASPKIKLRTTPSADLSRGAVKQMLAEKGFYDRDWNKYGQGFANQFKLVERKGKRLIIDENSGLTWQQSGSESMEHKEAHAYIEELNNTNYAGYSDWRLPTLEEAMSLMEPLKNEAGLNIDPIFDKNPESIWTADKKSASRAWVVYFDDGDCSINVIVINIYSVRAVR